MCGIAGLAALDGERALDASVMDAMLRCIEHRGPDDRGVHAAPGIVLGHRRLSIIDVAGGHQPLRGSSPGTFIIANGEIYNYRALRQELERRGDRSFASDSDSEVAAHAYDAWGLDFLERLDGMFALALWDGARRRLVLARDRMGEKPLYWTVRDGVLLFASELSALLSHPRVERAIDADALSQYLALEYVPAPRTMIRGVNKLEPGTALVLENGAPRLVRWWEPRVRSDRAATPSFDAAAAELRARLESAVATRLMSDVPLGVFLSGGIDSSTIAALAARHGALDTFSIGFDEPSFDESAHARAVARHIGSRHHERVLRAAEMPELVPRLGALLDEPIGDASIVPTRLLSAFARESVTVALGGDGGDELFGGYPMHAARRVVPYARALPAPVRHAIGGAATRVLPVSHRNFSTGFKVLTFLRGADAAPPLDHALWMSSFAPAEQRRLLAPGLLAGVDPARVAFAPVEEVWRRSAGAHALLRAMHLDATTYLPNDILTKVDRAAMSVALEVRAPFLAPDVVDFAFAMPARYHMRGLRGKRLLRAAVADLLPPSILRRPKKGFGIPVAAWLSGALRPLVTDLLAPATIDDAGLFRGAEVQRLLDEHLRGVADHRKPLWTLLVFELWRRETGAHA